MYTLLANLLSESYTLMKHHGETQISSFSFGPSLFYPSSDFDKNSNESGTSDYRPGY